VSEADQAGLAIQYIVNTHGHGDHTAGSARLKALTGAAIIIHALDAEGVPQTDIRLSGEQDLKVGEITFKIFHTPGHTPGGICLYAEGNLFTGDTLFVGDSGRTDLPGGHRPTLGASIRRLMQLPDDTVVWPGHDYGPTLLHHRLGKRHNVNARNTATIPRLKIIRQGVPIRRRDRIDTADHTGKPAVASWAIDQCDRNVAVIIVDDNPAVRMKLTPGTGFAKTSVSAPPCNP
jgi:glyoxylase-like metal-dependent hydrolase (beta-lactamase superfamily II)